MINTVLGKIRKEELGYTRMHEHLLWAWTPDKRKQFDRKTLVNIMLPQLFQLKSFGYDSLLEATTDGAGRDVDVLKELSEKSEINIITNCGVWDGLNYKGIYIPEELQFLESDQIAEKWINEFELGIDNSSVKPGFIKLGIGDNDIITDRQHIFLKAAITTSKHTGLPIVAHICSSKSAKAIVEILINEGLNLNKLIWSHADFAYDHQSIIELAKLGVWIEMSWHIGELESYEWHIDTINKLRELDLLNQLLLSQDAGGFHDGEIVPYQDFSSILANVVTENKDIQGITDKILRENPMRVFN